MASVARLEECDEARTESAKDEAVTKRVTCAKVLLANQRRREAEERESARVAAEEQRASRLEAVEKAERERCAEIQRILAGRVCELLQACKCADHAEDDTDSSRMQSIIRRLQKKSRTLILDAVKCDDCAIPLVAQQIESRVRMWCVCCRARHDVELAAMQFIPLGGVKLPTAWNSPAHVIECSNEDVVFKPRHPFDGDSDDFDDSDDSDYSDYSE